MDRPWRDIFVPIRNGKNHRLKKSVPKPRAKMVNPPPETITAEAKPFAGVKTGAVPGMSNDTGTAFGTRLASQGALLDVSDIFTDLQKAGDLVPVAPELSNFYDNTGRRSYYQIAQAANPFVNTYWQKIFQKYTGLSKPPTDWDGWWGSFVSRCTVSPLPETDSPQKSKLRRFFIVHARRVNRLHRDRHSCGKTRDNSGDLSVSLGRDRKS